MVGFFVCCCCLFPASGTLKYKITLTLRYKLGINCDSNAESLLRDTIKAKVVNLMGDWPTLCPDSNCDNAQPLAKCDGASSTFVTVTLIITSVPWVSISLSLCLPLSFCLPVCLLFCLSPSLDLSLSLPVSLYLSLSVSVSLSLSLYLSLSLLVSLSLSLSVPVSFSPSLFPVDGYLDLSVN